MILLALNLCGVTTKQVVYTLQPYWYSHFIPEPAAVGTHPGGAGAQPPLQQSAAG